MPKLIAWIKSTNDDLRYPAIDCLGLIGSAAKPAVPDLVKILEEDEAKGFANASVILALNCIAPSADAAIPALTNVLALTNGSSRTDRAIARAALIKMQAASLSPVLEQLKNTSDVTDWVNASLVVENCGTNGGTAAAVPLLVAALNQTNGNIQFRALWTLGAIHQQPELSLPAIVPLLESPNIVTRLRAIYAIRRFYKEAKPAVPALIQCLNHSSDRVRDAATKALRAIDPEAAAKAGIK